MQTFFKILVVEGGEADRPGNARSGEPGRREAEEARGTGKLRERCEIQLPWCLPGRQR